MTILYNIVYALLCLCLDATNFPLIIACFSCWDKQAYYLDYVKKQKIVAFLHSQFNFFHIETRSFLQFSANLSPNLSIYESNICDIFYRKIKTKSPY